MTQIRHFSIYVPPDGYMTMNDREHWRARAKRVAEWRQYATLALAFKRWKLGPSELTFEFEVRDKRRRDPHNYYPTIKAIVDGLVDAGLWPDDTPDFVSTREPSFAVTPKGCRPCVNVTITPREVAA